jgi:sporulation integral membrane protein YtvI
MKRWIWYGGLALAVIFYRVTWMLITPFILALAIAAMLNPVVNWLQCKTPLNRTAATVVVFVLGGLLGSGVLLLATAALVQGVLTFIELLPNYLDTFTRWSTGFLDKVGTLYLRIPPDVLAAARENVDKVLAGLQRLLTTLGQSLVSALGSLPGLAAVLLISVLAGFFITKDWELFGATFRNLLPAQWRRSINRTSAEVGNSLGRYILAQGIVIVISTIASTVGLLIIGVDRWLAAGMVGGLLDLVPVMGPALLYIPWAVYSWLIGQKMLAIWLLVLYGGLSALRQIVEPKVVGETLGIHPLVMMAGLYWGGVLFGAKGILIAPFMIIVIKAWMKVQREVAAARD